MEINITKKAENEAAKMAANMGETLDEFIERAIHTQIKIDSVVLEDSIAKTEEVHIYPVKPASAGPILRVLRDKGIVAKKHIDENKNYYIKAAISKEDFEYAEKVRANHSLSIRLPVPYEEYPTKKKEELYRIYRTTSFLVPDE